MIRRAPDEFFCVSGIEESRGILLRNCLNKEYSLGADAAMQNALVA